VNRRVQAVALFLLGVGVLQLGLTDGHLRFVKAGMRPLLLAAGLMLVATAAATLWYEWRHTGNAVAHEDDGHGHGARPRVAWLLLVPVAVIAIAAPQGLGADAARRSGSTLQQPTSDYDPLPPGDPVSVSLQEYASRAIFDKGQSMKGRTVRMIGFVMLADDGQPYLARILVTCCAADGRPTKVGMTGSVPTGLAADTWLSVTGTYTSQTGTDSINGAIIAFVHVDDAERIDRPSSPYQF
jgi:uncharacterized repeat protein (TIGR03943 family)